MKDAKSTFTSVKCADLFHLLSDSKYRGLRDVRRMSVFTSLILVWGGGVGTR
jgi:hypothetical protein